MTTVTCVKHYGGVIVGAMASQITNLTIFYSIVDSGADQRNTKAPRHWPLCGEFPGDRWIPRTKASNAENVSIWFPWFQKDLSTNTEYMGGRFFCFVCFVFTNFLLRSCVFGPFGGMKWNIPIPQISRCACPISHNAPFRQDMDTFLVWMG